MSFKQRAAQAYHAIGSGSLTDYELIAARAGIKHRIIAYDISSAADMTVTFESSTANERKRVFVAANGGAVVPSPGDNQAWFETAVGESLTVTTSAAGGVSVTVLYVSE